MCRLAVNPLRRERSNDGPSGEGQQHHSRDGHSRAGKAQAVAPGKDEEKVSLSWVQECDEQ